MSSIVIACGSKKRNHPAPARDMYVGSLFKNARRAAESTGLPWYIMSAKYGILRPDDIIEPYDMTYGKTTGKQPGEIAQQLASLNVALPVWGLVPARYADVLRAAIGSSSVRTPLRGLSMGMQQRAFKMIYLAGNIEEGIRRVSD